MVIFIKFKKSLHLNHSSNLYVVVARGLVVVVSVAGIYIESAKIVNIKLTNKL